MDRKTSLTKLIWIPFQQEHQLYHVVSVLSGQSVVSVRWDNDDLTKLYLLKYFIAFLMKRSDGHGSVSVVVCGGSGRLLPLEALGSQQIALNL